MMMMKEDDDDCGATVATEVTRLFASWPGATVSDAVIPVRPEPLPHPESIAVQSRELL